MSVFCLPRFRRCACWAHSPQDECRMKTNRQFGDENKRTKKVVSGWIGYDIIRINSWLVYCRITRGGKIAHPLGRISKLIISATGRGRAQTPSDASMERSGPDLCPKSPFLWCAVCAPPSLELQKIVSEIHPKGCAILLY